MGSRLNGIVEAQVFLSELPMKLKHNVATRAVYKGMEPILRQAELNLARFPRVAEKLEVTVSVKGDVVTARLHVRGQMAGFGNWLEFGTKGHTIAAVRAQALHFGGQFRRMVHVSGMQPRKWARPAFEQQKGAAVEATAEHVEKYLTKHGLDEAADIKMEIL